MKLSLGLLLVVGFLIVVLAIVQEARKENAIKAALGGKKAIIWICLTVLACCFDLVQMLLSYAIMVALVVWFVFYLRNLPYRIRNKANKAKNVFDEIKDGFTRK